MRIISSLLFAACAVNAGDQPIPDSTPVVEVFVPGIVRSETAFVFQKAQQVATGIYDAIGVQMV
jgi:hypothetical protein